MSHAERQAVLYEGLYAADPAYGTAMLDVADTVVCRIRPHIQRLPKPVDSAVDFGAGDGRFLRTMHSARLIRTGVGVDVCRPAERPAWLSWHRQAMWEPLRVDSDYAISTDALEHLPPEYVNASLANIARAAPHGFLRISLKEDRYGTERGLHLHESVFPAHDWLQRIRSTGIAITSYRIYFDAGLQEAALEVWY